MGFFFKILHHSHRPFINIEKQIYFVDSPVFIISHNYCHYLNFSKYFSFPMMQLYKHTLTLVSLELHSGAVLRMERIDSFSISILLYSIYKK